MQNAMGANMYRVWFNHWFSTAYNIIQLLKANEDKFIVVGSNQRINAVIKNVCDEWYEEPALDGEEYIEYCLEFCKTAKIDIFVPRRMMVEISENIDRFEALGVKVMVDKYEQISILNRKDLAYEQFQQSKNVRVPEYIVAKSLPQFEQAYHSLSKKI
jgi:carbamoylphosphate synthase large subunit